MKIVHTIGVTSKEYGELETRAKKCLRYEKASTFISSMSVFILIVPLLLYSIFVVKPILGREQTEFWEVLIWLVVGGMIVVVPARLLSKKARKYELEDDEWAKYYTYSIVDNLENYFGAKTTGLKRDYRKNAVKLAKDFLSCIKKRWKIGTFKLAQEHFGKSLSELQKNLEYRVIPTLKEKGDDNSIKNVEQIMMNFLAESRSLGLKGINRINEQMSKLPRKPSISIGFRDHVSKFFTAHRILKHGIFVLTVFVGCCVFYYTLVNHLQIQKEYALTVSVAGFLGLVTIYFRREPKEGLS